MNVVIALLLILLLSLLIFNILLWFHTSYDIYDGILHPCDEYVVDGTLYTVPAAIMNGGYARKLKSEIISTQKKVFRKSAPDF